jgi:crotonobetainyl-CoA:carnitine CoA-transferase CaiB-like acyl-CoA transferase
MSTTDLPLVGVRIVDLTDDAAGTAGRVLADLGADVVLVEPPQGLPSRLSEPRHGGHGLRFATAHANKRGVVLDLTTPAGAGALLRLTDDADIVLESRPSGYLDELGVGASVMRRRNPRLVVVSISDFGRSGPYRDWKASEPVLVAMSSMLTRSGAAHREPLLPPGELAGQTAAIHCAFVALLAYYRAQRFGTGDYADCALLDLAVQDLDPGFGMAGTATMGRPVHEMPPGRPDARMLYPIVACRDGHVRMFVASPKHWSALYDWMGRPEEFADSSYQQIGTRFKHWNAILPHLERLFADITRDEIVTRGSQLGIAIAALNTPREILHSDHVRARQSFAHAEIAPGVRGLIPNGFVEYNDCRAGFRRRAPQLGEHTSEVLAETRSRAAIAVEESTVTERPLQGVRVLDLGVIVVGAETGRELADHGAEVIKVENRSFMDGARRSDRPDRCSHPFALGNRGKRSVGINLRDEAGKALFTELVAKSDVVLTNFKPGTLESLGLGYEQLGAINPRIILVESSAFGSSGPWARRMGYGPLVRATVGVTAIWRHPDTPEGFGDDMTVYPDHAAARVGTVAVLAALARRLRTGRGAHIRLAQMETVFGQLATEFLRESLEPGSMVAQGNNGEFDAPTGVYPCLGDDAYCAVTVASSEDFIALTTAIGRPDLAADDRFVTAAGRLAHRRHLDAAVKTWAANLTPSQAQSRLQDHGVAAGAALHAADLPTDPQLRARGVFDQLSQPGYDEPLTVTTGPARFDAIPDPQLRPAPLMAADTAEVCRRLLAMTDADIAALGRAGVIELRPA